MSSFLNSYDVIIFDCDGVLIDINLLKCEAFGKAVEGYPTEVVESFVNHCKNTFGISRYVKFKEFLKDFAKEPFENEKYEVLIHKYAEICKNFYSQANITPGTEKLLSELKDQNKILYVASGSDEVELNEVLSVRKLREYFDGIYGSPKTKLECTSTILMKHPNKKAVFIGDALADMKVAIECNIDFVYMTNYTVQSENQKIQCKNGAIKVIASWEQIYTD